ncbi:MAG: response regulator [Candidatus Promineifilaceae bacterium]|nr:response regulator [Candidatus Promineifilaceae bacterium]
MADVKQILVVDDHFEMLEFLRSMLELSNRDHQVLGVPSAEEGFLELRRTPFDLVITDVRLPGMSGFELVRQIQALRPELPIIMITAYSSPQGKQEAAELGVYRYFEKPLDAEALLAAVHTALYGDVETPVAGEELPAPDETAVDVAVTDEARSRLQTLRSDTGAAQIVLAAATGDVIFTVGEPRESDVGRLARIVSRNVENSLLLARELSSPDPVMIHYQAGDEVDLYSANIGRNFFLMMLFDVGPRRGRIGTVWIFAQRAIKDLKELLQAEEGDAVAAEGVETVTREAGTQEAVAEAPERPSAAPGRPELPTSEPDEAEPAEDGADAALTEAPSGEETAGEDEAVDEEPTEEAPLELTEEDADFASLLEDLNRPEDVEAFWDEALADEAESGAVDGLSFEEAQRRGLIPPELGDPDE